MRDLLANIMEWSVYITVVIIIVITCFIITSAFISALFSVIKINVIDYYKNKKHKYEIYEE